MLKPIKQTTTTIALITALFVAGVIPGAYGFAAYRYIVGALEAEVEINARLVGGVVADNPELWMFEEVRLQELLNMRAKDGTPGLREVYTLDGLKVAGSSTRGGGVWPWISRESFVHDSGIRLAKVVITRSLGLLLLQTGGLFLVCLLLAALIFFRLRTVPLRMIDATLAQLELTEKKYSKVYASLREGLLICSVTHEQGGIDFLCLEANPSFEAIFSERGGLSGGACLFGVYQEAFKPYKLQLVQAYHAKGASSFVVHHQNRLVSVSGFYVNEALFALLCNDITEQEQARSQIEKLAYHDPLTGVLNRAILLDRMAHAIAIADRSSTRVAVFFIDLDQFKAINDTRGHAAGDQVLIEIARRLQAVIRKSDTLARVGGDEFVILAAIADEDSTRLIASKLHEAIRRPIMIGGSEICPGASVGVAVYPDDGLSADELLTSADSAMYTTKKRGRTAASSISPIQDCADRSICLS